MPPASFAVARVRVACAVLFFGTLLLFSRAFTCGFLDYDDPDFLTENPRVQAGLCWQSVGEAFTSSDAANWSPLTRLSHVVGWQMFGANPLGHHVINVVIHAGSAVLLFLFLLKGTETFWASAISAALFAWHPLRVESVVWIAERKDVLSVFFGLLSLLAYTNYAQKIRRGQRRIWGSYLLSLAAYITSLLSKPMLVTLPGVLLLVDIWPLRRWTLLGQQPQDIRPRSKLSFSRVWLEKIPFVLLAIASGVTTLLIQKKDGGLTEGLELNVRLANATVSIVRYLGKFFWSADLAVPYAYPNHLPSASVASAVLLLVLITTLSAWQFRRRPWILIGWLWFLGTLMPVLGLLQSGLQAMADRYTYFPIMGLQIAIIWVGNELLNRSISKPVPAALAFIALLSLMGILTWRQIGYWTNSQKLFEHTLAVTTDNYLAHAYLGTTLLNKNQLELAEQHYAQAASLNPKYAAAQFGLGAVLEQKGDIPGAVGHYRNAVALRPNYPQALYGLGLAFLKLGLPAEALGPFSSAVQYNPNFFLGQRGLGMAEMELNHPAEAIRHFKAALRIDPNSIQAHRDLAKAFIASNHPEEAIRFLQDAIKHQPTNTALRYELGTAYEAGARSVEAESAYEGVLQIDPTHAEAHYNLGVLLLNRDQVDQAALHFSAAAEKHPNFGLAFFGLGVVESQKGRPEEAIKAYQKAIQLLPNHAEIHNALGYAFAQTGKNSEAIEQWETAYRLDPTIEGLAEALQKARAVRSAQTPSP